MLTLPVVLATVLAAQQPAGDDPSLIARRALRAVEGDSVRRVVAVWQTRLARDSSDRVAMFGVATIARLAYDYRTSDRLYARLTGPGVVAVDRLALFARLGYGLSLAARWRTAQADTVLLRTLQDAAGRNEHRVEAEATLALAPLRARTDGPAIGRDMLSRAAPMIRATDPSLEAQRICTDATIAVRLNDPTLIASAAAGVALARKLGEPRIEGSCLFAMAQELERQGHIEGSLAMLDTAAVALRRAHHRGTLASVLQWRGYILQRTAQFSAARREYAEAVREAEVSGNESALAWSNSGLARLAVILGDFAGGVEPAARATALFRSQGDRWGLGGARMNEGELAAARGASLEARTAYADAIATFASGVSRSALVDINRRLAMLDVIDARWDDASAHLAAASEVAREVGMVGWFSEEPYFTAVVNIGRGNLLVAERQLSRLLATLSRDANHLRFEARMRLAEAHARLGRLDAAEVDVEQAVMELEAWRATLDDHDLRLAVLQARTEWGATGRGIPVILSALARAGRAEAAFRIAESRRALELADQVLHRETAREDTSGAGAATARVRRASARVTLAQVQRALSDSAALLEFVASTGTEPATLFLITRTGLSLFSLPPLDSLAPELQRFTALVESGAGATALARRLARALVDPALGGLPSTITRLIVVPDGPLHHLPFDALRLADGRWLVERFAVAIAPSATVAVRLRERPARATAGSLVAFGDPRFAVGLDSAAGSQRNVYLAAFGRTGGLAQLPSSAGEARNVARYADRAIVRLDTDASEAFVKHALPRDVSVLHFATHALVDSRVIGRSALALASGAGEDGFLGAAELAGLRLDADLVVLSGCRTATGVVFVGEGVQGLTAPLLEAGARAVVATDWEVGDRRAAKLIDRLYASMAAGLPVADALRDAKLDAIRRHAPIDEWAAFTLIGDFGARPAVLRPIAAPRWRSPLGLGAMVALAVLLVALGGYGARRMVRRRGSAATTDSSPSVAITHHR